MLIEVCFALGAFTAILARKERLGDGVTFDVCIERVARGERGVTKVALQITNTTMGFHMIFQGCLCFYLQYPTHFSLL